MDNSGDNSGNYVFTRSTDLIGDQLVELERLVQSCHWSADSFNQIIAERGLFYSVRTSAGKLIAYLLLQNQIDLYEVMQLSVDPNYRRQGIAESLLRLATAQVAQEGSEAIFLEVRESNQSAIALYHKLGFDRVGLRKNYYPAQAGTRESALLMKKHLSSLE